MSVLAPWLLAGLGVLAVPVLVHLIQKERNDVVPFPSLMFVDAVAYQSVRRQRIRDWLLFLLRCLAVILLVLAFARPFLSSREPRTGVTPTHGGRDIIIALDRSYSMGYGDRWRRAVASAKDVVGHMQSGDRATVVSFAATAWSGGTLTSDQSALRAAIDSVHPTDGVTRYDAVFRFAQHLFADTTQPRREFVLISDYQRAGWSTRELPSLPAGATLTQINLSDTAAADVAVTNADVRYDTSANHERVSVAARLVNHSAVPIRQRPVVFELNGREMQTRLVDCPANGVATVSFDPVFTPPGLSRGIVRTGTDALDADNRFYFMIEREPSVPVLVVEPPNADAKSGRFLTLALGIGHRLDFHVKTVRADQLSADALRGTSLVVFNGTSVPGGDLGKRITDYVKAGGGLLVLLGAHNGTTSWSSSHAELFPQPGAVVDRVIDQGGTLSFLDRGHPVFEAFNAPHSGDFSAPRFFRYRAIQPGPGDRELARFDDGHAALLERRVGAGRVLVWSSDVDGDWSDLPLQPVFLPLVHEIAQYTSGYQDAPRWETVGDVVRLPSLFGETPLRDDGSKHTASGDAPAGDAQYVAIAPSGVQARFTANAADAPASLTLAEQGFYDVRRTGGAGDSARTVAVNLDPSEADLTPLDTALFAAAVSPHTAARHTAAIADVATPADLEHRQRIWWYLLIAALLVLVAETLLSNRLSRAAT